MDSKLTFDNILTSGREPESKKTTLPASPASRTATTVIRISKDQAEGINVGDNINAMLSGKVKSIRDGSMNDESDKKYEIELMGYQISSIAMNAADFEMKRMVVS